MIPVGKARYAPTIGGVRKLLESLGYTVELTRYCRHTGCEMGLAHSLHGSPEEGCLWPEEHHDFVLGETVLSARKEHR